MKENCRFCQQGKPHEGTIIFQDTIDMGQFGEIRMKLAYFAYWDGNGGFLPQLDLWLEDNADEVISSQTLGINYCPLCGRKLWDNAESRKGDGE